MARRKKLNSENVFSAFARSFMTVPRTEQTDGMDLMEVFAKGLYAGMEIGKKQERAEQRKREGNGEG